VLVTDSGVCYLPFPDNSVILMFLHHPVAGKPALPSNAGGGVAGASERDI